MGTISEIYIISHLGSQKGSVLASWTDDTIPFTPFAQQHAQHQMNIDLHQSYYIDLHVP